MAEQVWAVVGDKWYTPDMIEEIEAMYGEGFLADNPFYPNEGEYLYRDGTMSAPRPWTLQERAELWGSHAVS